MAARARSLGPLVKARALGMTPQVWVEFKVNHYQKSSASIGANTHFADLSAKVIGDTAVVFGSMITTGDPRALRCAMVYAKRAGTWKMIAAQLVPVPETKNAGEQ